MAGPGDEIETVGGRGHLRASHADREQAIETLKAAFVQGMLVRDEFGLRAGQAFASRAYVELAALTAGLPGRLAAAQPSQPVRGLGQARDLRPGWVPTVATALYAVAWPVAFILPKTSEAGIALLILATLAYLIVLLICVGEMVVSRIELGSGRQVPQGPEPGAGSHASPRLASADPDKQLPLAGHWHSAEAIRRCLPRLSLPIRA